jgi:hypothetical protein
MAQAPNTQKITNKSALQRVNDHQNTAVTGTTGAVVFLGFDDVTTATSATTGSASALPTDPAGYIEVLVGGAIVKIPYYLP